MDNLASYFDNKNNLIYNSWLNYCSELDLKLIIFHLNIDVNAMKSG